MNPLAKQRLEQEIARIAAATTAVVGIFALHLDSGESISLNAATRFPMASVYKIPIALRVLHAVEQGQLALADKIDIQVADISPGSGVIKDNLLPGAALSIRNLLELTLRVSDNTASDILLRLAGGAAAVTNYLRSLDLPAIRVDRSLKELLSDFYGITAPPAAQDWSIQKYRRLFNALNAETKKAAHLAFLADERDTCTPEAMTTLLGLLQRRALLNPAHTDLLLACLRTSQMSPGRIKGLLPPGVSAAHKGGTLGECIINDVGLIRLPDQAGEVAMSIFVKATTKSVPEHERSIAHIARSLYDYYLFTPHR